MKRAIFPILLVAASVVLAVVITGWMVKSQAEAEGSYKAGILAMQLEFLKNNSVLRPITDVQSRPDLQKYLAEVNTLVNWYFKGPAAKFWQANPGTYDPEAMIKKRRQEAEDEGAKQRTAKSNLPIREECYELTRSVYDQFKQGSYNAVASDFQGSVRLDVHTMKMIPGENKLKVVVLIWGGIGPIVYGGWNMKLFKSPSAEEKAAYDKAVAQAKKRGKEPELKDPATLHYGESASASGAPVLPEFEGSDYIADFPPGVRLNFFKMPPCDSAAEKLQLVFKIKARARSGEDQRMEFKLDVPVESSWKGSWDGVQKIEAASDYD
jgi:hypothetical protein